MGQLMVASYIPIFIGVVIMLSIGIGVVSTTYDATELDATISIPAVPATTPPLPNATAGLIGWWDANDSSTITIGTGVSQWDDKSSAGNDVIEGTGTRQPVVVSADVNGRDVIKFDGIDDRLYRIALTGGLEATPNTVYMVVLPSATTASNETYFDSQASGRHRVGTLAPSGYYETYAGFSMNSGIAANSTQYILLHAIIDGASSSMSVDDSTIVSGNAGTFDMGGVTIGARNNGNDAAAISVGLVLLYNGTVSASDHADIVDYIEEEFDLGMTLTGSYSPGSNATTATGSTWSETQDVLDDQGQTAFDLIWLVVIALAAVIVVITIRKLT